MAADARAPARPARPAPARRALARAKVNYTLHVTGLAPDGRHLLDSLVVFPEIGDGLTLEPASTLSLALDGPFADQLGAGADNLALRAAAAALRPGAGAALLLEKILPVASGIGGGSADAAAALRLAAETGLARASGADLARIGLALGADVPVCLAGRPAMMRGIGELLSPAPAFPAHHIVLANPLCGVSTGAVFAALTAKENPAQAPAPARFARFADFIGWLAAQRNDLEAPARAILPAIGDGLAALTRAGAGLARMSGSGATVFGLFPAAGEALAAAERLRAELPGWWIADAPVRVWEGGVHGV